MKFIRQLILYAGLIVVFGGLIAYMLKNGSHNAVACERTIDKTVEKSAGPGFFTNLFQENMQEALPRLLLQIIIIIAPPVYWDWCSGKSASQLWSAKPLPVSFSDLHCWGFCFRVFSIFYFPLSPCRTCGF